MIQNVILLLCLASPVWAATDESLPYEKLDSGTQSGAVESKPQLHVIQDQSAWETFWAKHQTITPKTAPKPVDFKHKEILAVVDSDQPNSGYKLILDRIEKQQGELWVYVTREQPAPQCVNLGMVSQPFVFVLVDRFEGKTKLVFNTRTASGC